MTEPLATGDNYVLKVVSEEARAALLVACMRAHGMHIKGPIRAKHVFMDCVHVSCIVCSGDLCTPKTVRIPLSRNIKLTEIPHIPVLLPPPVPDMALLIQLLTQPIAMLALGGMLLLSYAVYVQNAVTDQLLALVGGRESGVPTFLFYAAWIAHAVESFVAWVVAVRLKNCTIWGALRWSVPAFLVGFPVLSQVLRLQKKK